MYIKLGALFLRLDYRQLKITYNITDVTNISLIFDSDSTFKIKVSDDKYLMKNMFVDDIGDSFYFEGTNLCCENEIIERNVHFLENNSSPLLEALSNKNYLLAEELIKEKNLFLNNVSGTGETSLMKIFTSMNVKLLQLFIDNADNLELIRNNLKIQTNYGSTILDYVYDYDYIESLQILLNYNLITREILHLRDNREDTFLMKICTRRYSDCLELLIQEGLVTKEEIDIRNKWGDTFLTYIFNHNRVDILRVLFKYNLIFEDSLKIDNSRGRVPLNYVNASMKKEIDEYFGRKIYL